MDRINIMNAYTQKRKMIKKSNMCKEKTRGKFILHGTFYFA